MNIPPLFLVFIQKRLAKIAPRSAHLNIIKSSWVHSSVARAADRRSAGPWFESGCALHVFTSHLRTGQVPSMVSPTRHRAAPGIEPGTSCTLSKNHTTRPSSHWCTPCVFRPESRQSPRCILCFNATQFLCHGFPT